MFNDQYLHQKEKGVLRKNTYMHAKLLSILFTLVLSFKGLKTLYPHP
jgi:hypothetical protein